MKSIVGWRGVFHVQGDVQGVGFRTWCWTRAVALRLSGYAMNNPDGSVEIVVEGTEPTVRQFQTLLEKGNPPGHVRSLTVQVQIGRPQFSSFLIR